MQGAGGHSGENPRRQDDEPPRASGDHPDGAAEQIPEDEFTHVWHVGIDGQLLRMLRDDPSTKGRRRETFDHDEPPCSEE